MTTWYNGCEYTKKNTSRLDTSISIVWQVDLDAPPSTPVWQVAKLLDHHEAQIQAIFGRRSGWEHVALEEDIKNMI